MDSRDYAVRTAKYVAISLSVAVGLGLVTVAGAVGDCSAFGGRCPADPGPLLEDDTFRFAAFGIFIATAVPVFAWRPSWRRLGVAVAVGLASALVVGLLVRDGASS